MSSFKSIIISLSCFKSIINYGNYAMNALVCVHYFVQIELYM